MVRTFGIVLAAAALTACATTTQLTSGEDYLAGYPSGADYTPNSSVDADVRTIAAVEPDLRFPARIGLARIENRWLAATPPEELAAWAELADRLGPEVGEFVPVSPMIAEMVDSQEDRAERGGGRLTADVVGHIRRGAARQHLDYVLVYEVTSDWSDTANALSLTDLSILGLFVIPSRNVEVEAAASALLIDVRNGYPYGTASAFAERSRVARAAYAGGAREGMVPVASLEAVENLVGEVETMVGDLRAELASEAYAKR